VTTPPSTPHGGSSSPPWPPNWGGPPRPPIPFPDGRPAARSPRRRRWIVGAAAAVVVLGIVGGLLVMQQQKRSYEKGHAAYLAGDCPSAVAPLQEATGTSDQILADNARAELMECEAFLAAGELNGQDRAEALVAYSRFLSKYPRSPMASAALANGQATVAEGSLDQVGKTAVCDEFDRLEAQQLVSATANSFPPLLRACGRAYEEQGDFTRALVFFNRFRSEFPDHPLRADVDADLVRVTLADAEAIGAGTLNDPGNVGPSGEAGGLVSIEILNGSAEALSLVLSGPEVRVEDVGPCSECPEEFGEPGGCPDEAPVERYVLEPGTYDVVVKASGGARVTPFRGTWHLDRGQGYASCFYIDSGS
jgi:hypothetical protein